MKVLMLGWDFSPRLSGGVGTACQGIANGLARAGTEVLFVLPRLRGDEEPENVGLVAADRLEPDPGAPRREPRSSRTAAADGSPPAASLRAAAAAAVERAPPLPSPAESLRLLAIESPLRPYQSAHDYARLARGLLERVRARSPAGAHPAPARALAASAAPPPRSVAPAPARVPPYGLTLLAEVERYARAVLQIAARERFDLIHAHDWMSFPAGMLVKDVSGKPLVAHFHSCEAERRGSAADPAICALEQALLAAADRIVCVSHRSERTLRGQYAVERARIRVVHGAFTPLDGAAPAKRGPPLVLYLGRLAQQKGPEVFLEAAARVREREPRARFVMAGAGELFPEVVELAERLGLAGAVSFTGFVEREELARTYASADVFVLPSAVEPFGITPLEALSMGVPAIVSKEAGVTEVLRSVLRFDPGDAEGLADRILALLRHPALRAQLAEQGLREVRKIRWDRPARALRGIYGELVA